MAMDVKVLCIEWELVQKVELELLVFFFSSRRRHTRLQGDWSSDVCSSDLMTSAWLARPKLGQSLGQSFGLANHADVIFKSKYLAQTGAEDGLRVGHDHADGDRKSVV